MTRTTVFLLTGLMLLSTACVIAVVDKSREGQPWSLTSEFHRTLDLESGGEIILENTNGDIEISGWGEEKVDITAYRRRNLPSSAGIYFSGKRFSHPDIRVQSTGESVRIATEEGQDGDTGTFVHYVLNTPRSVRLERVSNGLGNILISNLYGKAVVAAREGRVGIENYSGSLEIRLGSGSVMAELIDVRPGDNIRIRVERGDIVVYLEPGISARISLEAPAGNIFSELELNQPLPAQNVSLITGDGGASLEVTALQGNIRIRKVEESS